jgi:D-cysteine desulfhydrase
MDDFLGALYPTLARNLPKLGIANLPTPVSMHELALPAGMFNVLVKHDEATSSTYGGNKIRKLEYLLSRALMRGARRIATFGAAGSNHALATAIHADNIGLECTCFLVHQERTPKIPYTLNMHRKLGTEIVTYGKGTERVPLFRKYLQGRDTWVIPLGGTCWLGSVGFVAAGLELAQQIAEGLLPKPARIYIAAGTTGSVAGLATGLAAAGLDTQVHAIQVADNPFASERKLRRLIAKTTTLLNRIDPTFDTDYRPDTLVWRDEFLAGGYAKVDDATSGAIDVARESLGLTLETTYTAKALAAMLHDLQAPAYGGGTYLFWNTCNAAELPVSAARPEPLGNIPEQFERYYLR